MNATLFSIAPLKVICNGKLNPVDVTVTTTYTSTFSWLGVLDHRKQLDRPSTFGLCRTTLHITKDLTWTLSLSLAMVRNKHTNNQTKRQKKHRPSNGRANKQTILLEKEGLGLILKTMATLTVHEVDAQVVEICKGTTNWPLYLLIWKRFHYSSEERKDQTESETTQKLLLLFSLI